MSVAIASNSVHDSLTRTLGRESYAVISTELFRCRNFGVVRGTEYVLGLFQGIFNLASGEQGGGCSVLQDHEHDSRKGAHQGNTYHIAIFVICMNEPEFVIVYCCGVESPYGAVEGQMGTATAPSTEVEISQLQCFPHIINPGYAL